MARGLQLEWSVCIDSQRRLWVNIQQLVFLSVAVRTANHEVFFALCFFGHIADAETTNVVVAAGRDQYCVEVSEANGAVVLEQFTFDFVVRWVIISDLHVLFVDFGLDSDFVSRSDVCVFDCTVDTLPLFSLLLVKILILV